MSQGFDDNGYNAAILKNHPTGEIWGDMACNILRGRRGLAQKKFVEGDEDAIETLAQFDKISGSISAMLRYPMYIKPHAKARKEFVFILADMLNFIIRETQTRTGSVAYAGSLHGHERNLHQRFIHKDGNWIRYMGRMIELLGEDGVPTLFREARVQESLTDTWRTVCFYVSHARPRAGPLGDFQDRLQQFLQVLRSKLKVR